MAEKAIIDSQNRTVNTLNKTPDTSCAFLAESSIRSISLMLLFATEAPPTINNSIMSHHGPIYPIIKQGNSAGPITIHVRGSPSNSSVQNNMTFSFRLWLSRGRLDGSPETNLPLARNEPVALTKRTCRFHKTDLAARSRSAFGPLASQNFFKHRLV